MSAWLSEACISRSQPCLMFLEKEKKSKSKTFLTFVLLHSPAISPLRSSLFSSHKIKQSKEGNKQREGKVFTRVPSALGQPPAEDGCSQGWTVH